MSRVVASAHTAASKPKPYSNVPTSQTVYDSGTTGNSVDLEFNSNQHPDWQEMLGWNGKWAKTKPPLDEAAAKVLIISCSCSVMADNVVTLSLPGSAMIHKNFGNLFDTSAKTALLAFVELVAKGNEIQRKNIIVIGHYKCAAVQAAYDSVHCCKALDSSIAQSLKPLIDLAQQNQGDDVEQLAKRNAEVQAGEVTEFISSSKLQVESDPAPSGILGPPADGIQLTKYSCYLDPTGNLQ